MSSTTSTIAALAAGGVLATGVAGAATAGTAVTSASRHERVKAVTTLPHGFRLPIYDFRLSAPFGHHTGVHAGQHHPGQDFGAPSGTPIYSATRGKVIVAGPYYGYGNLVMIRTRNGAKVLYGHMKRTLVHKGRVVHPGQKIGKVGSTGFSTGPHLHFEVRNRHNRPVNPLKYLGVRPAQLIHLERYLSRISH